MADDNPMTNAFLPFDQIRERVKAAIEPLGVHFLTWNITPGDGEDGEERACEILMVITPDAFMTDEAKETQKMIEEMERGEKEIDRAELLKEQTDKARQGLLDIQKGGGLFKEDDSPQE